MRFDPDDDVVMNINKILFPTDFSRLGDAGFPLAESMARDLKAALIVLHVQEPPTAYAAGEWFCGPLALNTNSLRQMLENIKPSDPKIPCTYKMAKGDPARQIVRAAEREGADLIIMSTHGRTGLARVMMGSVAEKVIRRAKCAVLSLKRPAVNSPVTKLFNGPKSKQARVIVFATDFSPTCNLTLELASSLARDMGARLIIMHVEQPLPAFGAAEVYDPCVLDACSQSLKKTLESVKPTRPQVQFTHRMTNGDPANEILRIASKEKADLIVMGTHGHTGFSRVLLGSVAEKVVRRANCPVLTCKSPRKSKKANGQRLKK